jgi:DNA-binding transcriptional LysR family regulator
MNTAEVEVFLVLAEELHFGHTAERLRISQPHVSTMVSRLERRVGGALFHRTSRRVRLSPLGEQLRAELQPAWLQVVAALDSARAASTGITGAIAGGLQAHELERAADQAGPSM